MACFRFPHRAGVAWDTCCSVRRLLINLSVDSLCSDHWDNLITEIPVTLPHLQKPEVAPQLRALVTEAVPYQSSAPGGE